MDFDSAAAPAAPAQLVGVPGWLNQADPADAVTALYGEHALSLTRLAHIVLGSRAAAEDVVQEAFLGLYRRWDRLASKDRAVSYLRSSVLNGCRSALRRRRARELDIVHQPSAISAESAVLSMQERSEVARALRQLPARQREVLVLGYYLDLSDSEIAGDLEISATTVRSTRHRALESLARVLKERS